MKQSVLVILLILASSFVKAQTSIALSVKGNSFSENRLTHFWFDYKSAKINKSGEGYLNAFGEFYKTLSDTSGFIILVMDTVGIYKDNKCYGRQVKSIALYLKQNFQIDTPKIRVLHRMTVCRQAGHLSR